MSLKSALAKLPYGDAKATLIFSPKIKKHRKQFFVAYAKKINNLKGQFVTGTDIGLENKDIQMMRKYTPYVIGTKVDPAYYTAVGVYYGIKEALKYVFGSPEIEDRTFAIQGLGKTGLQLLKLIYPNLNILS
jgi:leucine dehydrogenase